MATSLSCIFLGQAWVLGAGAGAGGGAGAAVPAPHLPAEVADGGDGADVGQQDCKGSRTLPESPPCTHGAWPSKGKRKQVGQMGGSREKPVPPLIPAGPAGEMAPWLVHLTSGHQSPCPQGPQTCFPGVGGVQV